MLLVLHQVVEVDRPASIKRGVVLAQDLEHLAAPVRDLRVAALDVASSGIGGGAFLHQAPEERDVEPVLRALDRAVVQLARLQAGATLAVKISRADPSALAVDWLTAV